MSTHFTTPIGPPLTFEQGKTQPIICPFVDEDGNPLDITGKTLVFRIGPLAAPALYELSLAAVGEPTLGRAGGNVDADIDASKTYEYHVEDVDADRLLVRGPCAVRPVIGPA